LRSSTWFHFFISMIFGRICEDFKECPLSSRLHCGSWGQSPFWRAERENLAEGLWQRGGPQFNFAIHVKTNTFSRMLKHVETRWHTVKHVDKCNRMVFAGCNCDLKCLFSQASQAAQVRGRLTMMCCCFTFCHRQIFSSPSCPILLLCPAVVFRTTDTSTLLAVIPLSYPFMTSQVPVRVLGHSGAWCRFLVVWFGRFWCAGVVLGLRLRSGVVPGSSTKYETPSDRCALTAVTLSYHLAVGIPPWLILSRSFPVVIWGAGADAKV
jgi:hypothetical protein